MADNELLNTEFGDNIPAIFGTDGDFKIVYSSANNRLEVVDAAGNVLGHLADAGATGAFTVVGTLAATMARIGGGTGTGLRLGSNNNSDTAISDATPKAARFAVPHYSTAEEDVGVFYAYISNTANTLIFGGGSSTLNAATVINFITAENNSTTPGTTRLSINSAGLVRAHADVQIGGDIALGAGSDFTFNTTTGTKLGGAANQKLGFWGATAVTQPTAVADASGGATVDTQARAQLNALLAKLRTVGLIAAA